MGPVGRGLTRLEFLRQSALTGVLLSAAPAIVLGRQNQAASSKATHLAPVDRTAVRKLATRLRGQALLPGDEGYASASQNYAGQMALRPGLVVRSATTQDVVACVEFARDHDLPIAIRAGGHSFHSTDGGVLVNLSGMTKISVNAIQRIVRAGPGLMLGDFDKATQPSGLAAVLGECPSVGMAGFTLGGGLGRLMGQHGSACDNLVSADIVTADARVLHVSARENADLFWGIRGGGGNFGIVTSFEHRAHPVGPVLAGVLQYPMSQARAALNFFANYMREAPDELDGIFEIHQFAPDVPTVVMNICCGGDLRAAEQTLRPLRTFGPPTVDTIRPMSYFEAQRQGANPGGPRKYSTPKYRTNKNGFVTELADGAVDAIIDHCQRPPSASWSIVFDHYLHGAVCRVPETEMAFNLRRPGYSFRLAAFHEEPAPTEKAVAWIKNLHNALGLFSGGRMYLNYLTDEGETGVRLAFGANHPRLAALKRRYDPTNFFRLNPNIAPSEL